MLTIEIKNKVDSARNILVGKVPDPKAQVEQITTALIYKFMDDMDKRAMSLPKGKAQFFTNGYEKYSWSKMMDTKLGGQERLNLYAEAIAKMSKNPHLPPLFCNIFKDAFLPYRDPETLTLFLKEINFFQYDHSENLGDAFEYLLSILGSQGDAGQFRTPRHIIDFIVEIIDPKKDESILDPACGTAGFLISAYKHILKENKEKILNPDEKESLMNNLSGYDISPDMVRLSQVNMYLHGFPNPHIYEYDTLTSEEKWEERFDVMMANPPFMTPRGGIRPHKRFSVQANRCEVLFVDYIMEHLNNKGRAGIIVPEGIIFQSGKAYKELRKSLVNDGLFAVVSLPAGVFNPYSGVKTSILFFDNEIAKKTKDFLFVKVESDGYDLGAQRRKIEKNDLEDTSVILNGFRAQVRNGENQETIKSFISRTGKGLIVSKDKIAETGDYNLSADRYKTVKQDMDQKYPSVKVKDLISTITPPLKIQKSKFCSQGKYPIIDQSQDDVSGWTDEENSLVKNEKPLVVFGDHTCVVKYIDTPFAQGADGIKILRTNDNLLPKYLYFYFKNRPIKSDGYKRHFSKLKETSIPLPPLEFQKEIVEQIEVKQKTIEGAKQVIENIEKERRYFSHPFKNLKDVEIIKLGDRSIFNVESGGTPSTTNENYWNGTINWVTLVDLPQENLITQVEYTERKITEDGLKNSSAKLFPIDTVLVSSRATIGRVGIAKNKLATNQGFKNIIIKDKTRIHPLYLAIYITTRKEEMELNASGGTFKEISKSNFEKITIPIPRMDIQMQIIEEYNEQEKIIESNKRIIDIMKKKINEVLETL